MFSIPAHVYEVKVYNHIIGTIGELAMRTVLALPMYKLGLAGMCDECFCFNLCK